MRLLILILKSEKKFKCVRVHGKKYTERARESEREKAKHAWQRNTSKVTSEERGRKTELGRDTQGLQILPNVFCFFFTREKEEGTFKRKYGQTLRFFF